MGARSLTETASCGLDDLGEEIGSEGSSLAAYAVTRQRHEPVEPDLARSTLRVPGPGTDVHPVATVRSLLGSIAVVVLAAEVEPDPALAVVGAGSPR